MKVESTDIAYWMVTGIDIKGDMELHQSRVVMTLTKQVPRTGKEITFKTPQVTMFPEKDDPKRYHDAETLTKLIEAACEEATEYLNGKYDNEGAQIPLFPSEDKLQTNFTQ